MEKTNIGFKAGIILEKLGETGLITIAELARSIIASGGVFAGGLLAFAYLSKRKQYRSVTP